MGQPIAYCTITRPHSSVIQLLDKPKTSMIDHYYQKRDDKDMLQLAQPAPVPKNVCSGLFVPTCQMWENVIQVKIRNIFLQSP